MLIMATHDHTACVHPSVRNEPKSKSFPYSDLQLYPLSPALEKQLNNDKRVAGTLFATVVIEGLLNYSNTCKHASVRSKRNTISPWPLTPAQTSGLHAALYHLRHYIGMLRPERDG
jgi:hypothetical protein